jgi:transposase
VVLNEPETIMNSVPERVILGCDVSKDWLDLQVHGQDSVCRIDNARLAIDAFLKSYRGAAIAVEATNRFHELVVERAQRRGLTVFLISGYELKCYAEAVRQRMRNDPIDAELLARYLAHEIDDLVPYLPRAPELQQLWQLLKRRALLVAQSAQREQSFRGIKALHATGRSLKRAYDTAIARIEQMIRRLATRLGWDNDVARLCAVKGVGELTAWAMLVAYRSGRFIHHDPFVAYLGLDVRAKDSGRFKGQRKLSKRGDGEYRRLLHCAAMVVIRHQPYFQARYQALLARGLASTAALVVIARQLARLCFTLLHKQIDFEPARLGRRQAAPPARA